MLREICMKLTDEDQAIDIEMKEKGCLDLGKARFHLQLIQYLNAVCSASAPIGKCPPETLEHEIYIRAAQWKTRQIMYVHLGGIVKAAISTNKREARHDFLSALTWRNRHSGFMYYMGESQDEEKKGSLVLSEDHKHLMLVKGIGQTLKEVFQASDLYTYPVKFYTTLLPLDDEITYDLIIEICDDELDITEEAKETDYGIFKLWGIK